MPHGKYGKMHNFVADNVFKNGLMIDTDGVNEDIINQINDTLKNLETKRKNRLAIKHLLKTMLEAPYKTVETLMVRVGVILAKIEVLEAV